MTIQNPQLPSSVAQNLQQLTNISAQNLGRTGQVVGMGIQNLASTLNQWSQEQTAKGNQIAVEEHLEKAAIDYELWKQGIKVDRQVDPTTLWGKAYKDAFSHYKLQQVQDDVKFKAEELKLKHGVNYEAFKNEFDAYTKAITLDKPEEALAAQRMFRHYGASNYFEMKAQKMSLDSKKLQQSYKAGIENDTLELKTAISNNASGRVNELWASIGARLNSGLENGFLTDEDVAREYGKVQSEANEAIALNLYQTPAQIEEFIKAKPENMSDEEHYKIASKLKQRQTLREADLEKKNAQLKEYAKTVARDAVSAYKAGRPADNITEEQLKEMLPHMTPSDQREVTIAMITKQDSFNVRGFTIPQLEEQIRQVESSLGKLGSNELQETRLENFKNILKDKKTLAPADYLAKYENIPLQPLNPAKPQTFKQREIDLGFYKKKTGQDGDIFTQTELERTVADLNNPSIPSDKKVATLKTIATTFSNPIKPIKEIAKKAPTIAMSAKISTEGDDETAKMILEGEVAIQAKAVTLPAELDISIKSKLGNALSHLNDPVNYSMYIEGTKAVYAKLALNAGKADKDSVDSSIIDEAIKKTIGDTKKINGKTIILPRGVTDSWIGGKFGLWYDNLTEKDFTNVAGLTPKQAKEQYSKMELITVGNGKYYMKDPKSSKYVMNKAGNPFVLEYK